MITFQDWSLAVSQSVTDIITRIIDFIPSLLGALVIVVVGWIVGALLEWAVENVLRAAGIQTLFERVRVEEVLRRAEIKKDTSGLIGSLIKWIVLLVSFVAAAEVLHLTQISLFLNQILSYVPNVIAAAAILLVGAIFAHFMSRVVRSSVAAARLGFADAAAALTKYAILIFTILAALVQLGIAASLLQTLFTGLVAMLAIAGGLAFGLGGQDAARQTIERVRQEIDIDTIVGKSTRK